jgi:hypothetical protein
MASHLSYDLLTRLGEQRLSLVEEVKAQRHLATCARCRSELAWLERIRTTPRARHLEPPRVERRGWELSASVRF